MALPPDTPICRTPGTVSRVVGGETIVLDFASRSFFTLDEVGGRIWELIAEKGTLQEILGVVAEFDVDPERARADLEQLLSEPGGEGPGPDRRRIRLKERAPGAVPPRQVREL